jgi:rubrerythrin
MDVRKILSYALDREREGYEFFSGHARKAGHAAVVGIFERLAREEQGHIRFIEGLLAAQDGGQAPAAADFAGDGDSFFTARAASEMIEQTTVEAMVPDLPALRMAFLIERDLVEFYSAQAKNAEGEAKRALTMLADWERGHEELFRTLHDRVFAEYSGMPWGG